MNEFDLQSLSPIIGIDVEQVCFGRFDIQIRFARSARLLIKGDFNLWDGKEHCSICEGDFMSAVGMVGLLGSTVRRMSKPSGELHVEFDNDYKIQIKLSDNFESFEFWAGETVVAA